MEHIAAILLIVGCSQDLGECKELPAPTPVYETYEECDAELPAAFAQMKGSDDRVFARCVFVDPAMEEEDAQLVWDVENGMLTASVEPIGPSDVHVASNANRSGGNAAAPR